MMVSPCGVIRMLPGWKSPWHTFGERERSHRPGQGHAQLSKLQGAYTHLRCGFRRTSHAGGKVTADQCRQARFMRQNALGRRPPFLV